MGRALSTPSLQTRLPQVHLSLGVQNRQPHSTSCSSRLSTSLRLDQTMSQSWRWLPFNLLSLLNMIPRLHLRQAPVPVRVRAQAQAPVQAPNQARKCSDNYRAFKKQKRCWTLIVHNIREVRGGYAQRNKAQTCLSNSSFFSCVVTRGVGACWCHRSSLCLVGSR